MKSYKYLYSESLKHNKLHFAAHSHHAWPDCTFEAHKQYWLDSARMLDDKWEYIFSEIIPKLQQNIAGELNLNSPSRIVFAPNTHEFVLRLISCITKPSKEKIKILSTDSEFYSFTRQVKRWKEAEVIDVDFVCVEPYETFHERWLSKIKENNYDMVFTSYIYFNSGLRCPDLSLWVSKASEETIIVIDGYHSFFALPKDLSSFQNRIFFLAGGYKYAQSGEGVCFLYSPENNFKPVNTGWYASFESLNKPQCSQVEYSPSMRFAGSTFDPSGCYRMNSVFRMYQENSLTVKDVHERIQTLKNYFFGKIKELSTFSKPILDNGKLPSSHFLTFQIENASSVQKLLHDHQIIVDSRGDRLRFGFGLYHDLVDIDYLVEKLKTIVK